MTTTPQDSEDLKAPRALAALTELARDSHAGPTPADLDRGLDGLLARISEDEGRRRPLLHWSLAAVAVAACVIVGLGLFSHRHGAKTESPTLAYQIEGGAILEGGYLREDGHTGIKLSFNEGSRVALDPGTSGRLRAVDKDGAHVAVDHGTASFSVTRSNDRRWLVEAGPFLVTVKGTVFTVSWDPSNGQFALGLQQGRVIVSGPVTGGDVALRAGQRLSVNLPKGETVITDDKAPDKANHEVDEAAPIAPTAGPPSTSARNRTTPIAAPAKAVNQRNWADALANGEWDRILQAVNRDGLAATLDRASSEDLLALADAARYRRRPDLAHAALSAVRRRFPDSPRAIDAIYLLGRVAESGDKGTARAIDWYDQYLNQAPAGTYAAEALGRKMVLVNETAGSAQARPIADEYLRRFPRGSYAGSARALSRAP